MPTHIHISTPFMVVSVLLLLGVLALIVGALVARGRRKSEERIELARIAALKDRPVAAPPAYSSGFSEPRSYAAERGWDRGRTYSAQSAPPQQPTQSFSAAPAPVVMAAAPAASHSGSDALMGGMAGFMLGQAMGDRHDRVVHETRVAHEPSFRESAPTVSSDSGFTWDSGSSSSGGSSGGCDISFGD